MDFGTSRRYSRRVSTAPRRPCILVVDDDESMRLLISRILTEELPVECELAASGEQALHRVEARKFDLILLDLLMPDTHGMDVLAYIRNVSTLNRATPAAVISVVDDEDTMRRCRELGARAYVVKPILRQSLIRAVAEQLPGLAGPGPSGPTRPPK